LDGVVGVELGEVVADDGHLFGHGFEGVAGGGGVAGASAGEELGCEVEVVDGLFDEAGRCGLGGGAGGLCLGG
jgi:hypothetical protein